MSTLLLQLRRAISQGAALATAGLSLSCADAKPAADADAGGAGAAGSVMAEAGADGGGIMLSDLEPYSSDALGCSGTDYGTGFGFHGQCCVEARCYEPSSGAGCAASDHVRGTGIQLPPGSGSCLCQGGVQGPFAPNPADEPLQSGSCCYLVPKIACDGRPLSVAGEWLVADAVVRGDWAAFS